MGLAKRRKALGYSQESFGQALGVDRTTVGRWERWKTAPEAVHRPRMAELLQLSLTGLDALLTPPQPGPLVSARPPSGDHDAPGDIDDMIRRDFLRLTAIAGAWALTPEEAAGQTAGRDSAASFDAMNSHLWQVYQLARSKGSVAAIVRDQLSALINALKTSHRPDALSEAAADLFQLSGKLAFDSNRYTDAAASYTLAASASSNARSYDLWACALVRHAYVDVYGRRYREAAEILEVAQRIALRGDSALSTRHWVAAVQAEAYAGLGDFDTCERALDEAQLVVDLGDGAHNGGWLRFDGSRLAEERGARYVQLGRLDLAETALTAALDSQALTAGQSFRRRGAVLVDLASIGARRHDAEQVAAYGTEALQLARQSGSGYVARRLQALQADLTALGRDRRVAGLRAEISALCTT
ncbi:helix-turn-helix transcriptional regulator [Streptomyces sp. NBC_00233]|uniref:helix-turn-helix transcriptional regulator n=1 Tax=Streptomyces sp. NBC_00233 TaxID=2975686 RepID=UPI002253DC43|nr:helix-turn-helix domain-containing protein [Streptomyces sp. NBC_00233]MCX5232991.1 helix-turn-helix domain-containing protein [Streptomyces sp. NBC_00233]